MKENQSGKTGPARVPNSPISHKILEPPFNPSTVTVKQSAPLSNFTPKIDKSPKKYIIKKVPSKQYDIIADNRKKVEDNRAAKSHQQGLPFTKQAVAAHPPMEPKDVPEQRKLSHHKSNSNIVGQNANSIVVIKRYKSKGVLQDLRLKHIQESSEKTFSLIMKRPVNKLFEKSSNELNKINIMQRILETDPSPGKQNSVTTKDTSFPLADTPSKKYTSYMKPKFQSKDPKPGHFKFLNVKSNHEGFVLP